MKHASWSPEDNAEFDALMQAVVSEATGTGDRVEAMACKIADARQAHRYWAGDIEREALRTGYAAQIKDWLKRNRVLFAWHGQMLSKPRVIGRRATSSEGTTSFEQALVEAFTFDDLRIKKREYLEQVRAYTENIALIDRLLALADLVPGATTPVQACERLGVTVESWLGTAVGL